MNDIIIYNDYTTTCPVCGGKLTLFGTKYAVASPWWDGTVHHLFGAKWDNCSIDIHCCFDPGKDKMGQLDHIVDIIKRRKINANQ